MIYASLIPSHKIASWLIVHIDKLLARLGLGDDPNIEEFLYMVIVIFISIAVAWAVKKIVLTTLRKAVKIRDTPFGRELLRERTLAKCCGVITPLLFMAMIPFAFNSESPFLDILMKCVGVYALVAFAIGLNSVITFIFNRYNERENTRNLPIKGILNVMVGIVWIVIFIISISVLVDKSPTALLAGLGAFAAALMLIFKDSILGFVAGIQMSQNDMLRVGDWIVVPSTIADGIVMDVSLSVVKIRNWDNTVVMVPPYTLVSTSFQNWRGMSESGMRRIARSLLIDITTIHRIDTAFVDRIVTQLPELKEFVDKVRASGNLVETDGDRRAVNGSIETNLGLFRAYVCHYLAHNEHIASEGQILVRLMSPEQAGMPLQIWCWTATTVWNAYEAIQSAIFEHLAVVMNTFSLAIYAEGTETVSLTQPQPSQPTAADNGSSSDQKAS